jgi:HEAT repeat protein
MQRPFCLIALLSTFAAPALAQLTLGYGGLTYIGQPEPPIVISDITAASCGPDEFFSVHNIVLTREGLQATLQDPDSQVRMVSARQLACKHTTDAIPALTKALEAEKVDWVKTEFVIALARLGDENGWRILRETCDNPKLPIAERMFAAEFLLRLHQELHLETILEALDHDLTIGWRSAEVYDDRDTRIGALRLVRYVQGLSLLQSSQIRANVVQCLTDPDPMVRVEASTTLSLRGDVSAIQSLQTAVSKETDADARRWIAYNLNMLTELSGKNMSRPR